MDTPVISSSRERDSVFRAEQGTKECIFFVDVLATLWKVIFPGRGNFFFESEMTLMSSGLVGAKPPGNIRR